MAIVVVGSLNMDLVLKVNQSPRAGETVKGKSFHTYCGGKGANQAIAMGRLGADVRMIGKVGMDDYGHRLLHELTTSNVKNSVQMLENESTGIASIQVEENGENRIVIIPGANGCVTSEDVKSQLPLLLEASCIVAQLELPMETIDTLAEIALKYHKTFILNPAPYETLKSETLQAVTYLTPNEHELALMCDRFDFYNIEEVITGCRQILDQGVKNIIVTLGKKGALIVNKEYHELIDGFHVKAVDTTGAGDCFNGALATYIDQGKSLKEAVYFANAAGALSVTKMGAVPSLPTLEEVENFLVKL